MVVTQRCSALRDRLSLIVAELIIELIVVELIVVELIIDVEL